MYLIDLIYYWLYCYVVAGSKYDDIPGTYQETLPHRKAKNAFAISTTLYVYSILYTTGMSVILSNGNEHLNLLLFTFFFLALIFIYFSKKGRCESIIFSFYNKRSTIYKWDGLAGLIYYILAFVMSLTFVIVKYLKGH